MRWLPTRPLTKYLDNTYPELHVTGGYKEDKIIVLAERSGIDRRTFFRWFAGQPGMDIRSADKVCNGLGIHPAEIWEDW